jgi:hypothetical protein
MVDALSRARLGILTIALTYALSVLVGMVLVHTGNEFALAQRDDLIASARASDPSLLALSRGDRLSAALSDFGRNLFAGAGSTVAGLGIIAQYPIVAYRGWIGGIVSVNDNHSSRLSQPSQAAYYLITLILQLIPYSLAGGMGVNVGYAYLRPLPRYPGEKWHGVPKEALRDIVRVYLLIVPLFLIASLWEFFA